MIGESAADARIAPLHRYKDVETTILGTRRHHAQLSCAKGDQETPQARVDELAGKIEEEMEEFLYSSQAESLEQMFSTTWGCAGHAGSSGKLHGGLVAQRLTSISGSSRSFLGGAVVYSDNLKPLRRCSKVMIERNGA